MGSTEEGARFFGARWPQARAVADPDRVFSQSFGLKRGALSQIAGWKVWMPALRALRRGHSIGMPVGDPWQMPGAILVRGERILWRHDYRHSADHPDFRMVRRTNTV